MKSMRASNKKKSTMKDAVQVQKMARMITSKEKRKDHPRQGEKVKIKPNLSSKLSSTLCSAQLKLKNLRDRAPLLRNVKSGS